MAHRLTCSLTKLCVLLKCLCARMGLCSTCYLLVRETISHYLQTRPMDDLHIQQSLNVGSTGAPTNDRYLCSMFMPERSTCIALPLGRPTQVANPQHVTKFGARMFNGHAQQTQARDPCDEIRGENVQRSWVLSRSISTPGHGHVIHL